MTVFPKILRPSPASAQAIRNERALDRSGLLALLAAVLVLLSLAGASVWQSGQNEAALALAQRTERLRTLAGTILLTARAAETAQRGYLLTLNDQYAVPLDAAEATMPGLIDQARLGWPGDARVERLSQSVTAKMAELRWTATLAREGRLADAVTLVRTDAGLNTMRSIVALTGELVAEQDAQLLREIASATRGSRLLVALDVAGLIMVFALAGLLAIGLQRYLSRLRQAQAAASAAYDALEETNSRLDETVRARTAALSSANDEIQRFAYIVSHDLRAPLVNIMGFTSELEQAAAVLSRHAVTETAAPELREAAQEDIPEALRFIKSSSEKMDRLINAILRLSREGRRMLAPERLDMTALLHHLIETMQHQADVKNATIEVEALPPIVADRLAVEQVLGNVVENALKYLMPGRPGVIRITGTTEGRVVRLDVIDNGRGIAARDYERVFELFRRAGDQSVPGEGIGLAHVRALVRRLGGSIDCHSELGTGTTFTIRLPAVATYERELAA